MEVAVRADREGDHARVIPAGPFDLPHARTTAHAIASVEGTLTGCRTVWPGVASSATDRLPS